jgi:hypothetical protein
LVVELELGLHLGEFVFVTLEVRLHPVLLLLEEVVLLTLALARVVGGEAVALYTLDAALFLLVFGLGSLAWGQAGLGLGKHLAPRLPLLDGLAVGVCGCGC